jgi:2,4-dienoyl-CoA reductase-like NADH-dependent reductase (Old Yellow Enzyme family)
LSPLESPWLLGKLTVKNRVVMAPMATNLSGPAGDIASALVEHLERRARGGCGAVILESGAVERRFGRASERNLLLDSDDCIPGLSRIAGALHRHGCVGIAQLWHAGPRALVPPGEAPVSPSGVSAIPIAGMRSLATVEVREVTAAFGRAAERAMRSGLDAVEVHAAHGYLLHHFIDGRFNLRSDQYGGNLRNRYRILAEIREQIAARCPSAPVAVRLSLAAGDPLADIARHLEDIGYDAIDVRTGFSSQPALSVPPEYTLKLAAAIKRGTQLPVISGGRIVSPASAERAVTEGALDAVVLGRALLADPDWPRKAFEGAPVRECAYDCAPSCYDAFKNGEPLRCLLHS